MIAHGDKVVLRCTHSGVHTGRVLRTLPPTGHQFADKHMHIVRVVYGKGVENRAVRDDASLMRRLTP